LQRQKKSGAKKQAAEGMNQTRFLIKKKQKKLANCAGKFGENLVTWQLYKTWSYGTWSYGAFETFCSAKCSTVRNEKKRLKKSWWRLWTSIWNVLVATIP